MTPKHAAPRHHDRKKRPGIQLPSIDDYNEVHVMLQQRVEQWNAEILERSSKPTSPIQPLPI
jgi:hypothetical protein